MRIRAGLLIVIIGLILPLTGPAFGEETPLEVTNWLAIHGELKAHFRWSEDSRFLLRFPFPPEFIPRGQTAIYEQTVDPGASLEVSVASVILDLFPDSSITGRVKINFIDLYNRNPTSTDQTVDVKEAWLQFGRRHEFMRSCDGCKIYVLFGKAPKFERQPDRNLESYGMVSTAFNRFEDLQLQAGGDLGQFYWRGQVSDGNPVFFRDVNALAGDNGSDDWRFPNPELHLNSGFPILYDAETEEVGFHRFEGGGGFGFRHQNDELTRGVDALAYYYQRNLADTVDLRGTFYGGDLDLLDGTGGISLPIHGRSKKEAGGNLDVRRDALHLWVQIVHQDLAGLKRNGYEAEILYRFGLPVKYAVSGKQLFTFVQPVFRFSMLDNLFTGPYDFVAPSTFWDWKKYDFGMRLGLWQGIDLTNEFAFHQIYSTPRVHENEWLTTLRARF